MVQFVGCGVTPPSPLNNLLYANGINVRHVMTDGVWQILDGELLVDDAARVIERKGLVMATLWRQLEDDGFFVADLVSE